MVRRVLGDAIASLSVAGFKSIAREQTIEIRPLTLLAGTNSSGKSSMLQPLLLLKQTLENSYDPGALMLDGPNVKFSSAKQLLFRGQSPRRNKFSIDVRLHSNFSVGLTFRHGTAGGFLTEAMRVRSGESSNEIALRHSMTSDEIRELIIRDLAPEPDRHLFESDNSTLRIAQERCWLGIASSRPRLYRALLSTSLTEPVETFIAESIHLPGLRGNPERSYPRAAVRDEFPGRFQDYMASIVAEWQRKGEVQRLSDSLARLGLTWKVRTEDIDDTRVELQVGRLPRARQGGARDLVNIADVGLGVSQVLPVLVALQVAHRGQLVMLEQPEIHLHPRAQMLLASELAAAANRGVQVVAETHSSLLLRGVQTAVADETLSPDLVKLHWFQRDPTSGVTTVASADLDEAGAFGDWPEDFDDVALSSERAYLDAAELSGASGW